MAEAKVLIVDDDRSILTACRMVLEREYTVIEAENGADALRLLRENAPDVAIIDIGLREISGIDLLADAKSLVPETVVLIMTATEEANIIHKAQELGAAAYLVKPMDAKALRAAVRTALQIRHQSSSGRSLSSA